MIFIITQLVIFLAGAGLVRSAFDTNSVFAFITAVIVTGVSLVLNFGLWMR